eukprot:938890-Pyramimonas_sp.AAC.1
MPPKKRRRLAPVEAGDGSSDDAPRDAMAPEQQFSNLCSHLLMAWSRGLTPAAEGQRVAAAAHRDGLRHKE